MALFLLESPLPAEGERDDAIERLTDSIRALDGELIEIQYGLDVGRFFAIVEHEDGTRLEARLAGSDGSAVAAVSEVRLVGPSLDEVKAARGDAGYLVEWDLPAGLSMDAYIASKRAKAPLYAQVPETTFLRTYVCIDMSKCLCFYRAPDEAAVLRAREAVRTPVDRVTRIEEAPHRARV